VPDVDTRGESVVALENAIAAFPGLRYAHLRLSRESARRGDEEAALEAAKAGIVAPDDGSLLKQMGKLLAKQKRLEEAIAVSDRLIELDPFEPEALISRARLLDRIGRHREALEAIQRAIVLKPDNWQSHQVLSQVQRKLGNSDAALEAGKHALRLRPNGTVGLWEKARTTRTWYKLSRLRHAVLTAANKWLIRASLAKRVCFGKQPISP
jgi:Flp pilus assembly protein TadD